MSDAFYWMFAIIYITGNFIHFFFEMMLPQPPWWEFCWFAAYTLISFILAVHALIEHDWIGVVMLSIYALLGGWAWWNCDKNNRWRKKLADKAAAFVKDMGGRLAVIRPAGG